MIYSLAIFLVALAGVFTLLGAVIFFRLARLKITVTSTYVIFGLISFLRLAVLLEDYVIHRLMFDLYPVLLELAIGVLSFWGAWKLYSAVSILPNTELNINGKK